jgi:predicted branched-subunit amino acid permease
MWTIIYLVGLLVRIVFLVMSIDNYKKNKMTKKTVVIAGIICFIFCLPNILMLILTLGLSTGLVSM